MNHLLSHRLRTLSVGKLARFGRSLATRAMFFALFPFVYMSVLIYGKLRRKQYRFGTVHTASIGGWALQLDAFLRRTQGQPENIQYVFVPGYVPVINPYFYELMKRHVMVIENPLLKFFLTPLVRISNTLRFTHLLDCIKPAELGRYPPIGWFNEQDHVRGQALLKNLGINVETSWYVCFFARDNAYNETYNSGDELNYNLTYHSTRNSDIDTYESSMRFVLDQGGYVIRMGMVVGKPVRFKHPKLIDYPFTEHSSDFADVYLMCHGKFVIGCGSGVVDLSSIVNMPLGCVNSNLFWLGYERENMIFIPKLIKSTVTKKYLSVLQYHQLFSMDNGADNIIEHNGIMRINNLIYIDNSADDLLLVTKAMHQKFVKTQDGCGRYCGRTGQIWPEFFKRHPELLSREPLAVTNRRHQ